MRRILILLLVFTMFMAGCSDNKMIIGKKSTGSKSDMIPETTEKDGDGIPVLNVHISETGEIVRMDIESYLQGVVAGEMKNDWPLEALKAQAILARTFTLKFLNTKKSAYEGADISTDISEAQAYAPENINDTVRQAVEETKGIVMICNDELPHAWFHAHSGGVTELPGTALDFKGDDPEYLSVKPSYDSEKAPEDVKNWEVVFNAADIGKACALSGIKTGPCRTFEIGERGESGRAKAFLINGQSVSAPTFRINIGASKLKSTLIDSVNVSEDSVAIKGRGYGHGVGMSQWGAYSLAEDGATAESIAGHYFDGADFVDLW